MQCRSNVSNQVRSGNVVLIRDREATIGRARMIQKQCEEFTQIENTYQASVVMQATHRQKRATKYVL